MSSHRERQHAPLYAAGLPVWLLDALRRDGVAIDDFQTASYPSARTDLAGVNFALLYDSRMPDVREASVQVTGRGATVIDIATILAKYESKAESAGENTTAVAGLIDKISEALEAAGFYWVRVADYPHPYQDAALPASAIRRVSHSTNRPTAQTNHEEDDAGLCWRPSSDDYQVWSRFRKSIVFGCRSNDGRITIDGEFPRVGMQPALEIRRELHVARFPLKSGTTRIYAGALIFQATGPSSGPGVAIKETVEFDSVNSP